MITASRIILIGGSAGAYNLVTQILEVIPPQVSCAICIILHRNKKYVSQIEKSLSQKYKRPIIPIIDKTPILENNIYFAPAGYHLLVEPDFTFSLDSSEHINYSRPSIDVFFETCAQIYKSNCTAFILSGANSDGAHGLEVIHNFGGTTYIQDPNDAHIDTMPSAAVKCLSKKHTLSNSEIITFFSNLN